MAQVGSGCTAGAAGQRRKRRRAVLGVMGVLVEFGNHGILTRNLLHCHRNSRNSSPQFGA
jgi:hypothetical protein